MKSTQTKSNSLTSVILTVLFISLCLFTKWTNAQCVTGISSSTNVSCFGGNNGTATADNFGGLAPYTYSWSNGQTTISAVNLIPGNYTVYVTDDTSCVSTASITILEPSMATVTVPSFTDVSCNGANDGTASAIATGGNSGFTYLWSPVGGTTSSVTNLPPGNYTVVTTDVLGCTASTSVGISEPPPISSSSAGIDQTICESSTATLSANTPAFGIGMWSLVTGTATITDSSDPNTPVFGFSPGSGSVTLRWTIGYNSCPPSEDDVIITTDIEPTISNAGPDQSLCVNGNFVYLAGNTPLYGVGSWSAISGSAATDNSLDPNSLINGITGGTLSTFRWTISSGVCAPSFDDVDFNFIALPSLSISGDQNICVGESTTITSSGATTYFWTPGEEITASKTFSPSTNTTYLVQGTTNGCTANFNVDIFVFPAVTVNAGPDISVCANQSPVLNGSITNASGGVFTTSGTGTFSPDATTLNCQYYPSAADITAGVITITLTSTGNGNCQAVTDDFVLTIAPIPSISISGNNSICSGSSTSLSASGASTYNWSPSTSLDNPTVSSPIANPTSGITYTVTGTTGACSNTEVFTIAVFDLPSTANSGADQNTCNSTFSLAANSPSMGTGMWSVISGAGSIITPTSPTSNVTGLDVGPNVFRWTISNGVCSTSVDDVTINLTDLSAFATMSPALCNGEASGTAICSTSGGAGGNSYLWSPSGAITQTATGLTAGSYNVSVTDALGCSTTTSITITQPNALAPVISGSTNVNCNGGNDGTVTVTALGGVGGYTYNWSNASTTAMIIGLNSGLYTVNVTDANGCMTSVSQTITEPLPTTIANAGVDQNICETNGIVLSANNAIVGNGVWNIISGTGTVDTPTSPTSTMSGTSTGVIGLTWSITYGGCTPTIDTVVITVDGIPTIASAGMDQNVCGGNATLSANTPSIGTGIWNVISGAFSTISTANPNSIITGLTQGTTTIRWTISNGVCASSEDDLILNIFDEPTIANAGADITFCGSSLNLNANSPSVGIGNWSVLSGSGTLDSPNSSTSNIFGLTGGTTTLIWAISNGSCFVSSDTLSVSIDEMPTVANAGLDQIICLNGSPSYQNANFAFVGTSNWSVISGPATNDNNANSTQIIQAAAGTSTEFKWTITNGVCPASEDNVIISFVDIPVISSITSSLNPICSGVADTLKVISPSNLVSYVWSPSSGLNSSTIATPAATPSSTTTYSVIVTDTNGCVQSAGVTVNVISAPSLSGTINLGGNPVSNGKLYVYRTNNSVTGANDSTMITSGSYNFASLPAGGYYLRAVADPNAYPFSIPSYPAMNINGNTHRWDSSVVWNGTCAANDVVNFNVIDLTPPVANGATVGGVIWDDTDTTIGNRFGIRGIRKPGEPVKGVGVIIQRRPGGNASMRTTTDTTGNYNFANVEIGYDYDLFVEMPSGVMLNTYAFSVSSETQDFQNLNFFVDSVSGRIDTVNVNPDSVFTTRVITNVGSSELSIKIYPVPLTDQSKLSISISEETEIKLFIEDLTGRTVEPPKMVKLSKGKNQISLTNFNLLPTGVYLIRLQGISLNSNIKVIKN